MNESLKGKMTKNTDLSYAKWRLIALKKAGKKRIGQE